MKAGLQTRAGLVPLLAAYFTKRWQAKPAQVVADWDGERRQYNVTGAWQSASVSASRARLLLKMTEGPCRK